MKIKAKNLIIFVLLFNAITAYNQSNNKQFVIAADRQNILYAGLPNPISVCISVNSNKVTLFIPECNVVSEGNGRYTVSVPDSLVGKTVTITISTSKRKKTKTLGTKIFRVKPIPSPIVMIGANITGGKVSKNTLTINPFPVARQHPDFTIDLRWKIISYKVGFLMENMENPVINIEGTRFSEELIERINTVPVGTVVVFYDIKAQSIAGRVSLPAIVIELED